MDRIEKIFNELIRIKVAPQFGGSLLYAELRYRTPYRYDLIFEFGREYNNPNIKLDAVLSTCDELFRWVDIKDVVSIVIITENKPKHYNYFELFEQIYLGHYFTIGNYSKNELKNHPNYDEYCRWVEIRRRKQIISFGQGIEDITRKNQKKKFLFW